MSTHWPLYQWCFPHPFVDVGCYGGLSDNNLADYALTLVEQRMISLSYAIRSKPSWWSKYKDPEIRAKWKAEALQQEVLDGTATEVEVEYVLDELEAYERLRDEQTGCEPSCHHRVWQSDTLVSETLRQKLLSEVSVLESVPEDKKDWHPRSDDQVLDLVHPSLYCLVYGRTLIYPPIGHCPITTRTAKDLSIAKPPEKIFYAESHSSVTTIDSDTISKKSAWIPTDFSISPGGESATPLSYINNLHPSHTGLYDAISEVVARFSHMFDRVLTDLHPGNETFRRVSDSYIYVDDDPPSEKSDEEDYEARREEWRANREITMPSVPNGGYQEHKGLLEGRDYEYSIQGRECQIIVKLANIHLTPDKPSYPGGSWHIEGMGNERIVASGIYYYASENISESELAFRSAVSFSHEWYEQNDDEGVWRTFGLGRKSNQEFGSVSTPQGRCIAFPNVYQHCVSPFGLEDRTKKGYRKILALFLVDPTLSDPIVLETPSEKFIYKTQPKVPSTSVIPPQQSEWIRGALATDNIPAASPFHRLPVEIVDLVVKQLQTRETGSAIGDSGEGSTSTTRELGAIMTLDEAKQYRLELMDERTGFIRTQDKMFFKTSFNLCEH